MFLDCRGVQVLVGDPFVTVLVASSFPLLSSAHSKGFNLCEETLDELFFFLRVSFETVTLELFMEFFEVLVCVLHGVCNGVFDLKEQTRSSATFWS